MGVNMVHSRAAKVCNNGVRPARVPPRGASYFGAARLLAGRHCSRQAPWQAQTAWRRRS